MVGIRAPNMRNSTEKNRKPVLSKALLASFPILRYSSPITTPIKKWDTSLRFVSTLNTTQG